MNKFFDLSQEQQQALLTIAENNSSLSASILEKDLWVCLLLEAIFSLPVNMAFKGGTSLSKVFNLIHRFSEDIDITIDYRNFISDIDISKTSKSQLKKISNQLKALLSKFIENDLVPGLKKYLLDNYPSVKYELTLENNGEALHFSYPSIVETSSNGYLLEHVLLEFGIRNDARPNDKYKIWPYLKDSTNSDILFPQATVDTLSPIRTFWEKATLIHVECHRDRLKESPDRLSRHWYDLFHFSRSNFKDQALKDTDTFNGVIQNKKAFFNASYCNYDDCLNNAFKLIPRDEKISELKKDYNKMIEAKMFIIDPPHFDEIIQELSALEKILNTESQ